MRNVAVRKWLAGAAVASILVVCGCSSPAGIWDYATDRIGDALDIVGVKVGIGPNIYVEARATPFIRVPLGLTGAAGWLTSPWIGLIDGDFKKMAASSPLGIPVSNFQLFLLVTRFVEDGELPGPFFSFLQWPKKFPPAIRWLDVSVEVAAFLRLRTTISPGEALDFVTGFILFDLADDDG